MEPGDVFSADEKWDRLFADPASQAWMVREAARLRAAIEAGEVYDCDPGDLHPGH